MRRQEPRNGITSDTRLANQANEALVVSALAFVGAAALSTLPLTAARLPVLDTWFVAVSGVTTAGLSMVSPD